MEEAYRVRLVVQRQGSGYRARWVEEGGQESEPFDLELPLSEEDSAELRWYLEEYFDFVGAGTRVRAGGIEKRIDAWGRQLFAACFGSTEGTHVHRNLLEASKAGRPVLLTLGSNESQFLQQPWELMRDGRGPLAFQGVSIRRQLISAKPGAAQALGFKLPLRLLLIVARPSGAGFIDPRSSMAPLLDGLDLLPAGAVALEFCQPPTLSRLEELISAARKAKTPFHVVHFDGHGNFSPETGVGVLCFEKEDCTLALVDGQRLGDLLARLDIPLVMLEACRTSDLSDQPVFGSLAPALLKSGVGSVVAFSHSVHIEASRILVECFYRELASGLSVGQALSKSRSALLAKPTRRLHLGPNAASVDLQDWFLPQLYQVGADPAFLARKPKLGKAEIAPARPEERMSGFPPKPLYRFHGRARDLFEMERAFERHPALLLAGGGGMGKTALAREAAYWWLRTGRFELAVFVSFEQTATVERVVQELGRALEGPSFASRPGEEQQKEALKLFKERRVLLVWDNFESTLPKFRNTEVAGIGAYPEEESARLRLFYQDLAMAKGAGRLLVTCRPIDAALPGIKEHPLEGLERHDSLHLIHAIADMRSIDLERQGYERVEVEELLDLLGDHPLPLSLVGPHLQSLKPAAIRTNFASLLSEFKDEGAEEERNQSLLASLAFSASRLSEAAQAVLTWLTWFQGGAFETNILNLAQLSPVAWSPIRVELQATALLWVEEIVSFSVPFLRLHPSLTYASQRKESVEVEEAEQRFLLVYMVAMQHVDSALSGHLVELGMALMEREEKNFRSAIEIAFRRGEHQAGASLAATLGHFLQVAARSRERDVLADWARVQISKAEELTEAICTTIQNQALSLVYRGRADDAVTSLMQLIARLEGYGIASLENGALKLGGSYCTLGQVLVEARRPDLAVKPSLKALEILDNVPGEASLNSQSIALSELANAYRALGRLSAAQSAAERGLSIDLQLGRVRNAAVGIGQCAEILRDQERWAEATDRYQEALNLARKIGDFELQDTFLQHLGGVHLLQGNLRLAIQYYEQAMRHSQQAGDLGSEMRTCGQLASAEQRCGRFDAAKAWYGRARELAIGLGDQNQLGTLAHNMGVLYLEQAKTVDDIVRREALLRRAVASIEEGRTVWLERNNQLNEADSCYLLGTLYQILGDLDLAERRSCEALTIWELIDHPKVPEVKDRIAEIATARGNSA